MLRSVSLARRQCTDHITLLTILTTPSRASPVVPVIRWNAMSALAQPQSRLVPSRHPGSRHGEGVPRNLPSEQISQPSLKTPCRMIPLGVLAIWADILSLGANEAMMIEMIQDSPTLLAHTKTSQDVRLLAESLAKLYPPSNSLRFLTLAHTLGCIMKHNIYQGVAFHLARKGVWHGVLRAVSLGKAHMGTSTSRLLGWRTRALIETQDFAALETILQEYKEHGLVPSRRIFHLVLSGHLQNRDVVKAKQCLLVMSEAGIPPVASTYAIIATYYRALGMDPKVETQALRALQSLRPPTATNVLNRLIQLRVDCHDLKGAVQLLNLFHQCDVVPISTLLHNLPELRNKPEGIDHFPSPNCSTSIRRDLSPNATTFSIFINYLTSRCNHTVGLQLFHSMIASGISPTIFSVVCLVHLYLSSGQDDVAVCLVAELCSGRTPFHIFRPLLLSQDRPIVPQLPPGLSPTTQLFNALLRGLLRTRGIDITGPFLRIMLANNLQPNAVTLEILLTHLGKAKRSHPDILFNVLHRFISEDLKPTLRHMHIIISCMLRHQKFLVYGRGWGALATKSDLGHHRAARPQSERRFVRSSQRFDPTAGLRTPRAFDRCRQALPVIRSLVRRKILADSPIFALRIQYDAVLSTDIDAAKEVFHSLLSRGMRPSGYHFSSLMEGLAQSDDLEGAIEIMKSAEKVGIKPNVVMFTILITACARRGNADMALQIFHQMISAHVDPDVGSIDVLASAFFALGDYPMCRRVLVSLWPYIQPFPDELRHARLETLVRHFRSLAPNYSKTQAPSKAERRALFVKLGKLMKSWRFTQTGVHNISIKE